MTRAKETGGQGETFAEATLRKTGYQIIVRNYHSPYGEIDLVASQDGYLCFVEVKARRKGGMVSGAQSVTLSKQRKIIATALHYMQQYPSDLQPRFDVFSIEISPDGSMSRYDHLIGAFDGGAYRE